ncbi:GVQW3 protein, partial [Acromyrmex heyeri]
MQQVYGDDCLSRGRVHEWYTRFKNGREDINDDPHVGQAKFVITPESIEKVRDFLNIHPKSSLRFMEIELGMSKDSIHRILTEKLGYRKVCSHFVPHYDYRLSCARRMIENASAFDIDEPNSFKPASWRNNVEIRNKFCYYFNNEGTVQWQNDINI